MKFHFDNFHPCAAKTAAGITPGRPAPDVIV